MTDLTGLGGPVSTALESDLRTWVQRHGIVVWLDLDNHYAAFVDRLAAARKAGALPYEVRAFRGSHLDLMMALEGVTGGVEKAHLVIHLPGFTENTVHRTPLYELYAPGARYRKALDTLITEAAAGRVRPDQIDAFKTQPGLSLAAADTWLASLLNQDGGVTPQNTGTVNWVKRTVTRSGRPEQKAVFARLAAGETVPDLPDFWAWYMGVWTLPI